MIFGTPQASFFDILSEGLCHQLTFNELEVSSLGCSEIVVSTLFKDLTLRENNDIVSMSDCAQSVSDHDHSHLLIAVHQQVEGCLHLGLGLRVKG